MTVTDAEPREPEPAYRHVPSCRCRQEPDGREVADIRCLTPAYRDVVLALIAAAK